MGHPCKDWPDINIFHDGLMKNLELFERVKVDDGYAGEGPCMTKVSSAVLMFLSEEADARQKRVQRGGGETVNAHLRSFMSFIKITSTIQK